MSQILQVLWVLCTEDMFQWEETFFKKAERHQEIGTCQDSEMRRKDWIGSIEKRKEEIQRENQEVKEA